MKTFVAENVLCDETCGLIVIKAENKESALRLLENHEEFWLFENENIKKELRELKDNEVVYVAGGG
ncbi:MAG: hypothetical protein ACYDDE_00525 [bacterium]